MTQAQPIDTFERGIGIAVCSNDEPIDDIDGETAINIHGLLIPENTVLSGGQEIEFFFPPNMAQRAAEVLDAQIQDDIVHVVKNFHELEGQADADDIVGKVTGATYEQGRGVIWQGEITDEELANKIDRGYLEVSPSIARSLGGLDDQMQAREVGEVAAFRDVAIVGRGQDGVEVNVGTNPAIDALSRSALDGNEPAESGVERYDSMSTNELITAIADEYDASLREVEDALETLTQTENDADDSDDRVVTLVTE